MGRLDSRHFGKGPDLIMIIFNLGLILNHDKIVNCYQADHDWLTAYLVINYGVSVFV
jgi:hypothetical protein